MTSPFVHWPPEGFPAGQSVAAAKIHDRKIRRNVIASFQSVDVLRPCHLLDLGLLGTRRGSRNERPVGAGHGPGRRRSARPDVGRDRFCLCHAGPRGLARILVAGHRSQANPGAVVCGHFSSCARPDGCRCPDRYCCRRHVGPCANWKQSGTSVGRAADSRAVSPARIHLWPVS